MSAFCSGAAYVFALRSRGINFRAGLRVTGRGLKSNAKSKLGLLAE